MKRKLVLQIAGALCLLTCIAHLVGTFMEIPSEQVEMLETVATMKETLVPMPVGSPRNYMQILNGNNLCTALFLLLSGALFFSIAGSPKNVQTDRIILIISLCLGTFAVISGIYFFPIPSIFTGLAALLALVARSRPCSSVVASLREASY